MTQEGDGLLEQAERCSDCPFGLGMAGIWPCWLV